MQKANGTVGPELVVPTMCTYTLGKREEMASMEKQKHNADDTILDTVFSSMNSNSGQNFHLF